MSLPNPGMTFISGTTLPAADLNDMVSNIEYLDTELTNSKVGVPVYTCLYDKTGAVGPNLSIPGGIMAGSANALNIDVSGYDALMFQLGAYMNNATNQGSSAGLIMLSLLANGTGFPYRTSAILPYIAGAVGSGGAFQATMFSFLAEVPTTKDKITFDYYYGSAWQNSQAQYYVSHIWGIKYQ